MSCFGPAGVSNSRLAKRKCTKRSRNLVHLGVLGHFLERERSWRGGDCTPQRVGLLRETELDAAAAAGGNRHAGSRGIQVLPPRPPHVSVDRRVRIPAQPFWTHLCWWFGSYTHPGMGLWRDPSSVDRSLGCALVWQLRLTVTQI